MATWTDVRNYLHGNYRIDADNGDYVKMLFHFDDGRSQVILVRSERTKGDVEFVTIESPIGRLDRVDLVALLRRVGDLICGGLSMVGELVTLRHAVPLEDMSLDEFEFPLHAIAEQADGLESLFSAVDAH